MTKGRLLLLLGLAAISGMLVAAGASAEHADRAPKKSAVIVATRQLPKLGTVLVDSKGRTLYMFVPDKHRRVMCMAPARRSGRPSTCPRANRSRP